jgi:glutaredoxin 3
MDTLKKLIQSNKVLILSKTTCGYCARTKALFKEINAKDVTIVEIDQRDDGPSLQSAA